MESWWRAQQKLAVVRAPVALPPGDLQLDGGQVVRILKRDGAEVEVSVTRDLTGTLPAASLWFLGSR